MPRPPETPLPELLAPAGNWDCARAAVAAGADAIYFGLSRFNARLRADNFTEQDLPELMDYLHRHGTRGFVTMNTLVFTGELETAEAQLRLLAESGVDAVIIQDIGLAALAHAICPELELHASTQMTVTSPEGLAFVESIVPLGRVVLARELSVGEIERFRSAVPSVRDLELRTPLEVFVHGALCVAYSGQCLTSEALGQRSANRGECAQACRMPYEIVVDGTTRDLGEVRYLLSPQDLAAVDLIPDLVAAGVRSFKIEGRLKSPEYVAAVTRIYRKALDACLAAAPSPVTDADRYALEMTFSRGLSTGWLAGENHPYLTHGRFGKKRGPLLGTIAACGNGWITLTDRTAVPLAAGDGVVFDAGENRDLEQGARIWKIEGDRLVFHRQYSGLDFTRVKPGHTLYKTSDPKLEGEIRRFWQNARPPERKTPLFLTVRGAPGLPLVLEARPDNRGTTPPSAVVRSERCLEPADRHPLDSAVLTNQLGRLGDTPFELAGLENRLDGPCHLPLSLLNQLRRDLIAAMPVETSQPRCRTGVLAGVMPAAVPAPSGDPSLSVLCRTPEQVAAALGLTVPTVYCDFEDPRRYRETVEAVRAAATPVYQPAVLLATPRILKPGETGYLRLIENAAPDGLLLRNLGALHHYRHRTGFRKAGDFSLNVANPLTARILMERAGLDFLTLSYDLNIGQALDLLEKAPPAWFEITLHQHMPLFHMQHCVFCAFLSQGTTYKDCGRPCEHHVVHLRDRVGQLHRLQADVGCRNTVFNGRAQTGARFLPALLASGLRRFRIELLDESPAAAADTIRAYQDLLAGRLTPQLLLDRVHALEKLGVTEGTLAER
ncbi:MAG: U32 family peptidase [Verrucomicrobia bacterium]|nr:U32 family peptidase [Verrucomicrobiota bacterium]